MCLSHFWIILIISAYSISKDDIDQCSDGQNTYDICKTITWMMWTGCTATCGGGVKKRVHIFCCPTQYTEDQCLVKCNMTKSDTQVTTPCAQICNNGNFNNITQTCHCNNGYEGYCCQNDIDECITYPCGHGKCTNFIGGYTCSCDVGYTGQNCETDINECDSSPCKHGLCQDHPNGYSCSCNTTGYTGDHCENDIDECISSPCKHGQCLNYINRYNCSCDPGYTGVNCQNDFDECYSSPCKHGTCQDHLNGFSCTCNPGYTGSHCESAITTTRQILSTPTPKTTLQSVLSSAVITKVQTLSTNKFKLAPTPIQCNTTLMLNSTLNEIVWYGCFGETTFCDHGQCYNSTEGNIKCHCDNVYTGDRCDTLKPWIVVIITIVLVGLLTIVALGIWLYFPKFKLTLKGTFQKKHKKVKDSSQKLKSKINTNEELHVIEL